MTRARTIISLAVVAATSFALAACGGDDDSSGSSSESSELAAPLIDALAVEFAADAEMALDATEAECFATRFVNAIGAEELIAAGLTADALDLSDDEMLADMNLNDDQANGLADALLDGECFSSADFLLGDPEISESMTADQATCMSEAFTASESVREVMVASFLGEEVDDATGMAMFGELMMIMGNCGLEMDDDSSGSSSESSELAAPLIDALAVEFAADPEMALDATEAECFATRFVNAIGAEELIAAGLTADAMDLSNDEMLADMNLNDDQANGLADALLDGECFSSADFLLGDPEISEGMTDDQATCMSEAFTASESVREVMVASFLGEEVDDATGMAMFGELMMIMGNCGLEM